MVGVLLLDPGLSVEHDLDSRACELHAQRVPRVARDRRVHVLDRIAPAVRRVIQRDVVFERVRPRDVVVVAILAAPDHAARLVLLSLLRLELHLDEAVRDRSAFLHAPRKRAGSALPQHMRRARRGRIGIDRPSRAALAGDPARPAGWDRARALLVEILGFGKSRRSRKHRHRNDSGLFHR